MRTIDLKDSKIIIGNNLFEKVAQDISKDYPGAKVLIITDETVSKLHYDALLSQIDKQEMDNITLIFKDGEKTKCFENLSQICNFASGNGLNRGDIIIALGGGVIGDLAGFAAAVYLRGINFISIPTTLLAQVDSSVGGKTGINIEEGKNLVGSFYKASSVYIDTDTLRTLDDKQFKCGMAEVIKYGFIYDYEFYEFLSKLRTSEDVFDNIETIVYKCCKIKADVCIEDEFDKGLRMILNYGHTIGHAIENIYGYGEYTHGHAIAVGMAMITEKSEQMGLSKKGTHAKVVELIEQFGLEASILDLDKEKIFKATQKDKKNITKTMNLILLEDIGKSFIHKINPDDMVDFI